MSGVAPEAPAAAVPGDGAALAGECARIVRYLAGVAPSPRLLERYRAADGELFREPAGTRDRVLLDWVRRHAWSLPLLDAATALAAPDSRLRRKVLLTLALLETEPALADRFAPPELPLPFLAARLAWAGLRGALEAAAGLVLYFLLVGGRRLDREASRAERAATRP